MAENVGIYTDDSSMILKINQYTGYQELTCGQILEAIKNTDSYNENAIGFVAVPTNQEGYEVQALDYTAGDLLSIWNCFPDWTLAGGDTNYIYWNVSNPTSISVRQRQYFRAIFSNNQWKFNNYRDGYFGSHTYDGVMYYGKGSNSTSLSYTHAILYISNLSAFTEIYFNGYPLITYTWQSVPSISGKNGILSLVTLDSEAINDGEPVSGAAVSVFNQAPSTDNNVKDLADTYGSGEESSAVDVTVKYKVTLPPGGSFNVLKLVAKKDSIPEDATDGDKIVDISPTKTKKTVTGLDENSMYYFKIFAEDSNSNTSESDEKHILTSGDEGYNFDYTGEIIEWTVPKTGIYSLETWGAQGGNATDGTNSARGGYGAYAYGEVLLTQGEKLYINVGGQNGYNGGGNYIPPNNE